MVKQTNLPHLELFELSVFDHGDGGSELSRSVDCRHKLDDPALVLVLGDGGAETLELHLLARCSRHKCSDLVVPAVEHDGCDISVVDGLWLRLDVVVSSISTHGANHSGKAYGIAHIFGSLKEGK